MDTHISMDPVGAVASLANTVLGGIYQNKANQQQFKQQQALMDKSNSIWNQQNETAYQQARAQMYEAPKAEARGLRSAGLSPIWSQASSPISSVAGASPSGGSTNPQSIWQNVDPLTFAQIELLKSQKKKADADANKTNVEASWLPILNEQQRKWIETQDETRRQEVYNQTIALDNDIVLGFAKLNVEQSNSERQLEGTKYSADKHFDAEKYASDVNQFCAELSAKTGIKIAQINAASAKYCADQSLKGVLAMNDSQRMQWSSNLMVGMAQAGFNDKEVDTMVAYLVSGNVEGFKQSGFGEKISSNEIARQTFANALLDAQEDNVKSGTVRNYVESVESGTRSAKNISDIIATWVPSMKNFSFSKSESTSNVNSNSNSNNYSESHIFREN